MHIAKVASIQYSSRSVVIIVTSNTQTVSTVRGKLGPILRTYLIPRDTFDKTTNVERLRVLLLRATSGGTSWVLIFFTIQIASHSFYVRS